MKILGIDPGIARTGWGMLYVQGQKLTVGEYGCVETSSKQEVSQRLLTIHTFILNVIDTHKPDVVAVEELFFNTNAKTALIVGHARGIIFLTAGERSIPVVEYTPLQVKMALTGYGRAEKTQVGIMVKMLLKLETIPKLDDTADALAVAITHAFSAKLNKK